MPLQWKIEPERRFILIRATDVVSRADIDGFVDAMMANAALSYDKLFDAIEATTSFTADDMVQLGMRFRSIHVGAVVGALALVMPTDRGDHLERMLGMIAAADRPMRVFYTIEKARLWLDEKRAEQAGP